MEAWKAPKGHSITFIFRNWFQCDWKDYSSILIDLLKNVMRSPSYQMEMKLLSWLKGIVTSLFCTPINYGTCHFKKEERKAELVKKWLNRKCHSIWIDFDFPFPSLPLLRGATSAFHIRDNHDIWIQIFSSKHY